MAKKPKEPSHAEQLYNRCNAIVHAVADRAERLANEGRITEALNELTNAQRDLRDLKREVTDAERQIRLEATQARQSATRQSQNAAMFGKTAKKIASSSSASQKAAISRQQTALLAEYHPVKSAVDQAIANLDRGKALVRDTKTGRRATSPAQPGAVVPQAAPIPDPPAVPAQWAPDPSHAHQLRWWDGHTWTEHVSDAGVRASDPIR